MKNVEKQESIQHFLRSYISPATVDATFAGVFDVSKGYKVYAKPDMPTACTYFDTKQEKHIIFIGTDMDGYTNAKTNKSIKSLVRSLLIHELGHTLFTHVENKSLNKRLKDAGVPFPLFNLAEDARIEHLIKKEINEKSGLNYRFDWEEWFVNPEITVDSNPESILFLLINTEGKDKGRALVSSRVQEYYERFLNAKDSFTVIDILNEWKNEFHNSPNMSKDEELKQRVQDLKDAIAETAQQALSPDEEPSEDGEKAEQGQGQTESGEGEPSQEQGQDGKNENNPQLRNFGDIGELVNADGEPVTLEEFLEDAISIEELNQLGVEMDAAYRVNTSFDTVTVNEASAVDSIFDDIGTPKTFYPHEVKKIEKLLKNLQKVEKTKIATRRPTNRFNTGRMFGALSDPAGTKIFKRDRERLSKKTEKNIMFILDLSGSMSGKPIRSARTLLIGANKIAQQNKNLNITVLGSKISSGFEFQTIHLPANENALLSVSADGGAEGIGHALEEASSEVKKNEIIVFLTDGHIHDKEISKKHIGKFLKKDAVSIGIYVDDNNSSIHNQKMKSWFDELIVKDNMADIIERVVEIANAPRASIIKKSKAEKIDEDEEVSVSPSM